MYYSKEKMTDVKRSIGFLVLNKMLRDPYDVEFDCEYEGDSVVKFVGSFIKSLIYPLIEEGKVSPTEKFSITDKPLKFLLPNTCHLDKSKGELSVKVPKGVTQHFYLKSLLAFVDVTSEEGIWNSFELSDVSLVDEGIRIGCENYYTYKIGETGMFVTIGEKNDWGTLGAERRISEKDLKIVAYKVAWGVQASEYKDSCVVELQVSKGLLPKGSRENPVIGYTARVSLYSGNLRDIHAKCAELLKRTVQKMSSTGGGSILFKQPMNMSVSKDGKTLVKFSEAFVDAEKVTYVINKNSECMTFGFDAFPDLVSLLKEKAKDMRSAEGYYVKISYIHHDSGEYAYYPYDINVSLIF